MPSQTPSRGRLARLLATGVLAIVLALLLGRPSTGIILHSITIDGNVSDWGDVLTDPENVVADAGSFSSPPDPDAPGTSDRDARGVAYTWDSTNLYLFLRRTLSGNSAFEFLVYVDLGHDGRLNTNDVIVRLSYNGAAFTGGSVRRYVPINAAAGDAITGDGVDEPGTMGVVLPGTPTSANSPDGIEFEAAVPWTALGVSAGSCLWMHPSIARGINLPSQVEDNTDPLDTQDVHPTLIQDHDGSTASPGFVDYAHRACNQGSCGDVLDLTVRSGDNWKVQLFTDPNGDGNPADGVLLATDGNGDGDYSDARDGDVLQPGADTNGNGLVDTGTLGASACFNYVVRVFAPPGVTPGAVDVESVRARSATRPRDLVRNTDHTNVGPVNVFSNETETGFPGDVVWIPHVACNQQAFSDTIDLSATDTRGWTLQTFLDPNSDGDPSDAVASTSTGVLAPGTCAFLFVRATIPAGETAGSVDTITLRGTSRASTSVFDTATDTVTVFGERFSLTPNHDRDAGPGNFLFLPHVIQNHQGSNDSFQLNVSSADPTYTITLMTDPNGDGEPDDSTVISNGSIVGPVDRNGGQYHFIVRVNVPTSAVIGSTNTVTVTARSQINTTRTDVATDIIRIRRILTYSDPLFARPSKTFFTGCSKVYVQAHGLQTNREYRFVWIDPASVTERTSPSYSPDARGRADDSFALPCGIVPGQWSVKLQIRSGSAWNDVSGAVANFSTLDPAVDGGDITALAADQPIYNVAGDNISVESTLLNDTLADYVGTFADYVIFRDADGNGQPTTGETFIQGDGTSSTWDPGEFSHRTDPIEVLSTDSYEDYFRISSAQFGVQGTWCVHERWVQRCNSGSCSEVVIDTALQCFLVSCLPAPAVDAGAPKTACSGNSVSLSDSSSDGNTFQWSDGGAGGTFSPSATVLHPTWLAPGAGSYTLTLTATYTATGCSASDTVAVTINPRPAVNAGPDRTTCAGDGILLSGATSTGDTHSWSDGGAGGTFTPSSSVLNPTYTPPDPSPASVTLTLTSSIAATGCSQTDTALVTVNPNPAANAGTDKTTCAGNGIALSDATSTGTTFAWSDGGAGGSFTPSASVLNPTYVPADPAPATVTLTLTASLATGCDTADSLLLTVNPKPAVNAGADKTTCAGDGIALGDATSTGTTLAWSDGGAGGSFTPSSSVLNPTYVPPDPSPASVTLTLTASLATGCQRADALVLTVNPNPTVDAGANKTTCAGDGIALSDATSSGNAFTWSDGGAGGSFTPSASVLNPTYVPADPAPASVTLQLVARIAATGCDSVDTLTLTVNPKPAVDAGANKTTCAGDGVALGDSSSTGTSLAWNDGGAGGAFTPSASVLHPTYVPPDPSPASITLTLTASLATGCQRADTLALTVKANPTVDAGANKTTCAGDGIALSDSSSSGNAFAWSDGGAGGSFTPNATVLHPTYAPPDPSAASITLTLTATDSATGCDSVDALSLTVNPKPAVNAGTDKTTCAGDGIALSDATSTGTTLSWSDGGAGGSFTPSAAALNPTYVPPDPAPASITLTLTASLATGCQRADSLVLAVNANPVVNAGADRRTCAGDAVALGDSSSTGATQSWNDGGAGGSFSPSSTVLHPTYTPPDPSSPSITLTLTSVTGACDSVDSLVLSVDANPVVNAGADASTCAGQAVALSDATSTGDTHSWTDGGAGGSFAPSSSALNPTYTPPDPSPSSITLTLTSSVGSSGCDTVDARVLTVNPRPTVTAGADKSACAGVAVSLSDADGGAATTFSWSDGGAGGVFAPSATVENPSYSNATPGTRTLTFTASIGATGCSRSDTVLVTVNPKPVVDAGAAKDGCAGSDVALNDATSDADSFSWSDGGGGGTFTPSASVLNPSYRNATTGTYVLTLVATHSATGCQRSDTVTVTIRPLPAASFTFAGGTHCEDADVCFVNSSTDATSYSWDFGDGSGSVPDVAPCHAFASPGTYTVSLTAINSCGSSVTTRSITISPKPVADFSFSTQGNRFCRNKDVSFTDLSSNSPTSWQWDFGDGATSTSQNPSHQYLTDGVFVVRLVACNACGCSVPHYEAVSIAATCNTNCEANSNQIDCGSPAIVTGDTCSDHDSFNTTSYPCAPGIVLSGENKTYDLNFVAGANFIITLTETVPEPNGYDLDLLVTDACNPPHCVSWGDTQVTYDDRTAANDDFFLIVDGRDGSCGPYRLDVQCLDPTVTAQCTPPDFQGIVGATDENPCLLSGILVTWNPAASWGLDSNGQPCSTGTYEIWRAPVSDLSSEQRVGTATPPATSFLDVNAVPGTDYQYKVHAINGCCAEPIITTATATATDQFGDQPVIAHAGPDRTLGCSPASVTLQGSADGGSGGGFTWSWSPTTGLSDPTIPNPVATAPGTYTLTVTDATNGCVDTDTVVVSDAPRPVASAGADKLITCTVSTVQLDGSASGGDASAGRTFSWAPAAPLDDASSPTPHASSAGTFTLTVTDLATGCASTDDVVVTVDTSAPTADAGPDLVLTCTSPTVTLQGAGSGGNASAGYAYAWTPAAGLDDPTSRNPVASTDGTWTLVVTSIANGCASAGDSVTVTRNQAAPTADAGPDRTISCGSPDATLDGSASGGDGSRGYSFSWSPPENFADPNAEDPTTSILGTYTLTVTDLANGCTATDTVDVVADPNLPIANAGPDKDITCNVSSVTLEGSASGGDDSQGYAFHWDPSSDVSDPDVAQPTTSRPGAYTLTVTTIADGCRVQDVVVVHDETQAPVASAGPDKALTCAVTSVVLEGSASGNDGRDGFDYAWSPAAGLSDPNVAQPTASAAGTYTLRVTDRYTGCVATDAMTVSSDLRNPVANAGLDKTITCTTPSVTLDGFAAGGNGSAGYSYSWSPAAGLSDPSIATPTTSVAGTWTLTVTDLANGCTGSDVVTTTLDTAAPLAEAGPSSVLTCTNPIATLLGSASGGNGSLGYDYAWSPASQVSDATAAQPTTAQAGTYTLTVTDRANGCTSTDTTTVTANQSAPIANAGADKRLTCTVTSVVLQGSASGGDGSAGYSYSWTPTAGLSNPTIAQPSATIATTYTLTVTSNANGCTASDTVLVVADTATPVANAGADKTITCTRLTVVLDGSASGGNGSQGYAYSWAPTTGLQNPTTATPTALTAGTWTLTVTDVANGCTSTDTVTVTRDQVNPLANAGPNKQIDCFNPGSVQLDGSASGGNGSAGYSYSWSPASGLSSTTIPNPRASTARTYTLTVTDLANGCTDTDTVVVTRDERRPTANAGFDRTLTCDSPTAQLNGFASGGNGSLGYAFSWTPSATLLNADTANPTATASGSYTLTVTDLANGCVDTDTVNVLSDNTPPTVSAGPDIQLDCTRRTATLQGSASGGDGSAGYTYDWVPTAGLSNPAVLRPTVNAGGTYTLTVTDVATGCTGTDVVTVTEDYAAPTADAGPDKLLDCGSAGVQLDGAASGGNGSLGYDVSWTPSAQVSDPAALVTTARAAGTYTLKVTDRANGCSATDTVVVTSNGPAVIVDAGPDGRITCTNPAAALTGTISGGDGSLGYDARWSPITGVADPASAVTTTTVPGTYTLTGTDRVTGCTSVDTVTIVDGTQPPVVANAGADLDASCIQPGILQGSASGGDGSLGYSYAWSPATGLDFPDIPMPQVTRAGTYTLTVTDLATGCTATDTVVVGPLPVPVPGEPSALDQNPAAVPFKVRFNDPITKTTLALSWQNVGAFAYDVHQGTIAAIGPPNPTGYDHAPVICAALLSQALMPRPTGNVYFIVVAANCQGDESSYGRTSYGVERPDSQAASGTSCP